MARETDNGAEEVGKEGKGKKVEKGKKAGEGKSTKEAEAEGKGD